MDTVIASQLGKERSPAQRAGVLILALLQVLVPLLPDIGLGETVGSRSNAVRTLITPAGWAFAIWGPLYAGSIAYAIYQALPSQRGDVLLDRIGWYMAGAFLGNALWAGYTQLDGLSFVSVAIIVFSLFCLLKTFRAFADYEKMFSRGQQWLAVLPLSALAAWLTAASIVNIAASLTYHGVDGGTSSAVIAATVVIISGVIAAAALGAARGNPWYAIVFLWALAAIYFAGGQQSFLVACAVITAVIFVVATTVLCLRHRENRDKWFSSKS